MQNLLNSESNDEIDLKEIFITLWAYKLFIAGTCALGIILGGYYVLNADKIYVSSAVFKLDQGKSSGISLGGELGALASFAGFGGQIKESVLPVDVVTGRIFIQNIDEKLNFQTDPHFNTYNPNYVDPVWKSLIKRAIGLEKSNINAQEAMWQGIVRAYSKNVKLDETKDGSIKISVTHKVPQRAAEIANGIMNKIISDTKHKKDTEQDQQLSFLSNTLAKALRDLELSQSNLKKFTLENSALPLKSFAAESLQLEALREQFKRTSELREAVAALALILQNKTKDQNDYLALRQEFPIVDQVEFRRVLGQNEIISSWSWPELNSVNAVYDTLSERKSRLQSQINTSQANAERSGLAMDSYAKLQRESSIAEATYTVLIEQVKAQSMVAGFRPNNTEVYEYASASISPSAPNRTMILALGGILGLLGGAMLSLVLAIQRGVYYSKNSLKIGSQARFTASVKPLLPLRNKILSDMNKKLMIKSRSILRDISVEIHKGTAKQVVVTSSQAKMTSNNLAQALAGYLQSETMKIAVINFSSKEKKLGIDIEKLSVGSFVVSERAGHISVLKPDGDLAAIEMLSQREFWGEIQSLNSTFDLVFMCADNADAISLLSALEGQKIFHMTIARTKKTKSATLMHMYSLLPIQGLLYD
jgi:uncharacterized protein involved in exopolysaccharide biosynthesis